MKSHELPNPFKGILENYVLTPHGLKSRNDCTASTADPTETLPKWEKKLIDSLLYLRQRGPAGWIESGTFTPSVPLGSMSVRFTVPDSPAMPGALIYLFPAAENPWMTTILQPVLQWGDNFQFGGGEQWTTACWYCSPDGKTTYSCQQPQVRPGETIVASMSVDRPYGKDSCDWKVEIKVENDPGRCASLAATGIKDLFLFLVGGALEAYSLDLLTWRIEDGSLFIPRPADWRQYPASGSTTFNITELVDLNERSFRADWNKRILQSDCGLDVSVSDDRSTITLTY
jgi:hypothetical protein